MHCRICIAEDKVYIFLQPTPTIKVSETDMDGDAKEAVTTRATMSMNMAVVVLVAEDPEVMEGIQVVEDTDGSIIVGTPEGELVEGLTWQAEQLKQEHRQETVECAMPSANAMVEEAPENNLDVQEVFGLVIPEMRTLLWPG